MYWIKSLEKQKYKVSHAFLEEVFRAVRMYKSCHDAHALRWCACIGETATRMRARTQVMALLGESLSNAHAHGWCCLSVRDLF